MKIKSIPSKTAKNVIVTIAVILFNAGYLHAVINQKSININPDPSSEPWIAGGVLKEQWKASLMDADRVVFQRHSLAKSAAVPSSVDNTKYASFRPVFNQRGASCAQASGIGYVYTYEINYARGLSSQVSENQYPYDYTYNFLNGGDSLYGSTTIQGWYIVRAAGIPNVNDYGGFGLGKFTQWISGYDKYYKGLSNRLKDYFSIYIRSASNLDTLKQWLYDHGNGSSQGGCLVFCADAEGEKIVSLASGTPSAGKKAIIAFGTSGGHAMTVAGYNDEIRYDYNKDGKYTNNIDLNRDNIIDVRDYEIGGVLMVNSWGDRWMDNGKSYVMYKALADEETNGGIYSNQLIGIQLDNIPVNTPKLTVKFKISHSKRDQLKIKCGYSTYTSSAKPFLSKSFSSAFNRVGGAYPMQGISTEALSGCLDISEYSSLTNGKPAAFYLVIESMGGSGTVNSFSVIDNTCEPPVEYACSDSNVNIVNGITTLKLVKPATMLPQFTSALGSETNFPAGDKSISFDNNRITIKNNLSERIRIYRINGTEVKAFYKRTGSSGVIDVSQLAGNSYILKSGILEYHFTKK